jgi:hypothetical protein
VIARGARGALSFALLALGAAACSLGEGEGEVKSDKLAVTGCWNGQFDLRPDFFAASPYQRILAIRLQRSSNIVDVSDGVNLLVDDIDKVRQHIASNPGVPLKVGLPPNVVPPGVPVTSDPDPPLVHLTLYLHRACHRQNAALYSLSGGIVFRSIFNGDRSEKDPDELLTEAEFDDIVIGDPRDRDVATNTVLNQSHLRGRFKFYFERGQPAQPFP